VERLELLVLLEDLVLRANQDSKVFQVQREQVGQVVVQACPVHTVFQASRERWEHRERKEQRDLQDLGALPAKQVNPVSTVHMEHLERRDHKARLVILDRLVRLAPRGSLETPVRWEQAADQGREERLELQE